MGIFFNEGFFNKAQKKKEDEKSQIKLTKEEEMKIAKEIQKVLSSIIKRYVPKHKAEIRKEIDAGVRELRDGGYDNEDIRDEYGRFVKSGIPTFSCTIENIYNGEVEFLINDDEQYIRIAIWKSICDIAKEFKNESIYKLCKKVDTGDGDEGGIWVTIDPYEAKKYLEGENK